MPRQRIHIMHVQDSLEVGGMENGIVNLANNIDCGRFRVSLCCLNSAGALSGRITNREVNLYDLAQGEGRACELAFRLRKLYREKKVDIVHTHNYYSGLYGIVGGFLAGVPAIVHGEHGDLRHYGKRHAFIMRCLAGLTDHFVAVSRELKGSFAATIGLPENCIETISNGVELDRFSKSISAAEVKRALGIAPFRKVVGCVGRLVPVKNYGLVIEALAQLALKGCLPHLLFVGDGPCRQELEALAKKRCIPAVFTGERHDTPALYAAMDVFVLPSQREGMSNTVLEAMAAGKPVVATAVGGNNELVEEGVTGYLVPPDDVVALAAAMRKLLDDGQRARSMGEAGCSAAQSRFSLERMVKDYEAMYVRLLQGKGVELPCAVSAGY